ncbi:hypothetical protein TrLO_g12535 [Triparma laevis f. longispina]|uniref:Membrane transporter protein n=1 Tax=Triparma laevis f. longispina TaxID=1714387 RepID=A0A9W7A3Q2_9STRA|nr:hypothetical protein TrLO_g12535 [Triparma laevis f. longispina]
MNLPLPSTTLSFDFSSLPLPLLLVQTLTSLFASTFGFGDAVLAMPLLLLLLNISGLEAVRLVSGVSVLVYGWSVLIDTVENFNKNDTDDTTDLGNELKESSVLLLSAIVGVPIGGYLLSELSPLIIRLTLGVTLISYGVFNLVKSSSDSKESDEDIPFLQTIGFGFIAGILGGTVSEPGPPVVVYSSSRNFNSPKTRRMLARFILPVQMFTVYKSGFDNSLLEYFEVMIPVVGVCSVIGKGLGGLFDPEEFKKLLYGIIVGLGGICVYNGLNSV